MRIIPFKEPSFWQEQIQLSGVTYTLKFKWNALNKFWSMDIYLSDNVPVVVGVKIVNNWNLLEQYSMSNKPLGDILCQSIVGTFEKITREGMTNASQLVYYEQGELNALQ